MAGSSSDIGRFCDVQKMRQCGHGRAEYRYDEKRAENLNPSIISLEAASLGEATHLIYNFYPGAHR